ncbi:unnamed protein product [Onchocerca flexuosa]|uniref:EF-hand domain-containing protein n=1 Tax=Onchocerca flexuosa TaxID=387005 RepID=A0A183I8A2_9BILA|nr:unnamed protein product [Onchocerca flexuosa]
MFLINDCSLLNLIFFTKKIFYLFLFADINESEPSGSQPLATLREGWLGSVFDEADIEKCGCLSESEAVRLIKQLNPRILLDRVENEVKVNLS